MKYFLFRKCLRCDVHVISDIYDCCNEILNCKNLEATRKLGGSFFWKLKALSNYTRVPFPYDSKASRPKITLLFLSVKKYCFSPYITPL